ncbi:MAG TPA: MaoC family dehydratase [Gaiellaceae bacterium]|jgi:acyl dehydratase|nr:MaoC family dehydratase [Gaiellaceae bacterium]
MRYFEDIREGEVTQLGSVEVTREEIMEFARRYDPQPFHVDEEAAALSPYGGLIASGWHTAAMFMRLFVDAILLDSASVGSPGVEELRWLHPVRPGDVLTGRVRVVETRESQRNPTRGTVITESEAINQDGEVVMRMRARGFFARRGT